MNFSIKKVKGKVALIIAAAFVLSAVVAVTPSTPANATTPPGNDCVVKVIHHDAVTHQEFKYSKVIKGQASTSHDEFQYSKVTTVYTVEHKVITIPSSGNSRTLVINWLNSVGGVNNGNDEWQIPDNIVNAAGVKVIGPGAVAPSGNVPLSAYGGPNVSVHYEITAVDITTTPPTGSLFVVNTNATIYYVHGGNPTATLGNANWTTDVPAGWTQIHTRPVSNNDATPDKTVFYLSGGGQSTTNTDANWTTETPSAPWVKSDERRDVEDKAAWDEKVYGPCPQDATATATVKDAASCLNPSTVDFTLVNATWDAAADLTVGTHTRSATSLEKHLFGNGTKHLTVSYTIADADPSLCPQTAVATAVTDQVESCLTASTIKFDLLNATWDAPADLSVGMHTRNATSDKGTLFANGTRHLTVTYTIVDADPTLCPLDASASVSITQQEGCLVGTEVAFAIANADWDAAADLTVGTHTRSATAHAGVNFPDGKRHLTVTYTIKAADPKLCPQDATASISIDKAATCTASETVKLNLVNATADSALVQTVGTQTIAVTATAGHLFNNGTAHASVSYTVKDKKTDASCASGGIATDFFGEDPNAPLGGLTPFGAVVIGIMLAIGAAVSTVIIVAARRRAVVS